jgi:hypothetical protein
MSFNGGECSRRGRCVSLLKCCVSRLLESADRAKRTLALGADDVWKEELLPGESRFRAAGARMVAGNEANDIE